MTLVLEIEHLLGVAFAAQTQAGEIPDWPPQPDRVFSALVATWGARGEHYEERDKERAAVEWLEMQPAPHIAASAGFARAAPTVFVPPNDFEIPPNALSSAWFQYLRRGERPPKKGGYEKEWRDALSVVPFSRTRSARCFPAYRPNDPIVSLIWRQATPDAATLDALNALAADTAYIGHSASLTRCRFHQGEPPKANGLLPRRRVYSGRLAELEQSFHARPLRRPSPGAPVRAPEAAKGQAGTSIFADRWLVLEHVGGTGAMPDIRAAALGAKALRNAIMSGYREIGLGDGIPAKVSGHSSDGKPSS
jgi:CRISPR-associated protein Csb2